jgi:aldehyde dehydrogenase (NAD+)
MSRVLVQDTIADKVIERIKSMFLEEDMKTGYDPLEPTTYYGPMADLSHFKRVMSYIESAKKTTEVLTGGSRKGSKGYFIEPTVFLNPSADQPIYTEEIFGPVMVVNTFSTPEEAVRLANDTDTGLAGEHFSYHSLVYIDES